MTTIKPKPRPAPAKSVAPGCVPILAYAGIGTRDLTRSEVGTIQDTATALMKLGLTVYSGNADGSDMHFQIGSRGKNVVFLPWKGFNDEHFNHKAGDGCLDSIDAGMSEAGAKFLSLHPNPNLTDTVKKFMRRNAHQVLGWPPRWPKVQFVLCCADQIDQQGHVKGGTGHAVRIAIELGVPVINIRVPGWEARLAQRIAKLTGRTTNFKASVR